MMRLRSVPHSFRLLILHAALAKLYLLNIPANKVCQLNERAEKRCHFNVFPHECITELLSQTIANRDGQIEVVTQERQMRDRNRRDKKAWGEGVGVPSISIQCCTMKERGNRKQREERSEQWFGARNCMGGGFLKKE